MRKLAEGPCPTVLLKADTGADVNLLNSTTFNWIIGDRLILQPSTLRMETYGSCRVEVLGKFNAFLRWKGKIFRQPFFVTTANLSPNLLSRDACYTLGVVRPCYSVDQTDWSKYTSNTHIRSASKSTKLTHGRSASKSTRHDGSTRVSTAQLTTDPQHRG